MKVLYKLRLAPLMISLMIMATGYYYIAVKAGIPYQDPTAEMTEKYIAYWNTGESLVLLGFIILIISIIYLVVLRNRFRRKKSCKKQKQ